MQIRRFQDTDAEQISLLVRRNLTEVNIRDYPIDEMRELADEYRADKIRNIASNAHMYVACEGDDVIGTGSISSFWGSETESVLLTIFVLPELHATGVGRSIVAALERDEYFLRASQVEVPSSITARAFYEKMGYRYKNDNKMPDAQGLCRMEKVRLTHTV